MHKLNYALRRSTSSCINTKTDSLLTNLENKRKTLKINNKQPDSALFLGIEKIVKYLTQISLEVEKSIKKRQI
jgi:hypothetical protein